MRKFSFLSTPLSYLIIGFVLYGLFKFSLGYKILLGLGFLGVFFVSRKSNVPYRDTLKNDGEIYLAPVYGIVKSIRHHVTGPDGYTLHHEVRVAISFWNEKGLYLPTSGEVSYLKAHKGEKVNRDAPSESFYRPAEELEHTDLILTSKNQTKTLMRFIDCQYGKRPTIWLKSGDRGRGAACFGYYPFGGTLIVYVPANSDILVFDGERLVPGQTVIAALKDNK